MARNLDTLVVHPDFYEALSGNFEARGVGTSMGQLAVDAVRDGMPAPGPSEDFPTAREQPNVRHTLGEPRYFEYQPRCAKSVDITVRCLQATGSMFLDGVSLKHTGDEDPAASFQLVAGKNKQGARLYIPQSETKYWPLDLAAERDLARQIVVDTARGVFERRAAVRSIS